MSDDDFFTAFRRGSIAPPDFDHRAHLRAAACALARMPFLEACIAMREGLKSLAQRAGEPDLYNETVTVSFVAMIAEALDELPASPVDVDALIARRPQLLDRRAIAHWYDDATLASRGARERFRMPRPNVTR